MVLVLDCLPLNFIMREKYTPVWLHLCGQVSVLCSWIHTPWQQLYADVYLFKNCEMYHAQNNWSSYIGFQNRVKEVPHSPLPGSCSTLLPQRKQPPWLLMEIFSPNLLAFPLKISLLFLFLKVMSFLPKISLNKIFFKKQNSTGTKRLAEKTTTKF